MNRREPTFWIFSATGIVMLIAMGIFVWSVIESSRQGARVTAMESPRTGGGIAVDGYELLSRVYPPAYRNLGGTESAEFLNAIHHYSQRDYTGAITGLSEVIAKQPDLAEAHLYLGICYLYSNNRAAGVSELRKAVHAGNTPYLEQSRFYLAKGLLGGADIAGAREQLNATIAMHGDLEQQAEVLLARVK